MSLESYINNNFIEKQKVINTAGYIVFRHWVRNPDLIGVAQKSVLDQYVEHTGYQLGETQTYSLFDLYAGGQGGVTKGIIRLIQTDLGIIFYSNFPESTFEANEIREAIRGARSFAEASAAVQALTERKKYPLMTHPDTIVGQPAAVNGQKAIIFPKMMAIYEATYGTVRKFT